VPQGAWDEADATRPNPLLTALRTGPAKPAHAVQPPAPDALRPAEPSERVPAYRRNQYLSKVEAYLALV